MKKIIYSLVIMIAAGSLFTSCIAQTEADSTIEDLRLEKLNYIKKMHEYKEKEIAYMDALAQKVLAEKELIEAQKELLEQQTAEAEANAKIAAEKARVAKWEADLRIEELMQKMDELKTFLSPAKQKAYISAALAYYGAAEAVFALELKLAAAEEGSVEYTQLARALEEASKAKILAKKYYDQIVDELKEANFDYFDMTEVIEDILGALPDDMKSAIMDKIMKALASIVD